MKIDEFKLLTPFQQAIILLLERAVKALESLVREDEHYG